MIPDITNQQWVLQIERLVRKHFWFVLMYNPTALILSIGFYVLPVIHYWLNRFYNCSQFLKNHHKGSENIDKKIIIMQFKTIKALTIFIVTPQLIWWDAKIFVYIPSKQIFYYYHFTAIAKQSVTCALNLNESQHSLNEAILFMAILDW